MQYKKEFALSVSCLLLALLCSMIWLNGQKENLAERISPHILRFHVVANSNSRVDQEIKLQVKSLILEELSQLPEALFSETSPTEGRTSQDLPAPSAKEAICQYILEHRELLEAKAEALMASLGYPYEACLQIAQSYFPTKSYGDIILPCGTYDAVQVSIGAARGRNWWCVLYPRLCFVDATHAIVPDSSKLQLKTILGEEDYRLLLDNKPLDFKIRFRLLETFQDAFFDK